MEFTLTFFLESLFLFHRKPTDCLMLTLYLGLCFYPVLCWNYILVEFWEYYNHKNMSWKLDFIICYLYPFYIFFLLLFYDWGLDITLNKSKKVGMQPFLLEDLRSNTLCFTIYCNYNDILIIHNFCYCFILLHLYQFLSEKHLCFKVIIVQLHCGMPCQSIATWSSRHTIKTACLSIAHICM